MASKIVGEGGAADTGASSRPKRRPPLYAAVDLGTNNCRLLVAAPKRDGFTVVDSYSQVVRLGEGLEATGRLSDASIERAMEAMGKIASKLKAKNVSRIRCIATEACRRAENGAAFIERVRTEAGLNFEIISPEEEAQLALIGCHNLLEKDSKTVLVLDVGGGSTELSYVDAAPIHKGGLKRLLQKPPIRAWISLPVGVVTLTEAFLHLPEDERYPAMLKHVQGLINKWNHAKTIRKTFRAGESHVIGTSGTVTCLTGVHLGLPKYRRELVDGQWITHEQMMATIQKLIDAGPKGREKFPTIGTDRAALMLAGCAIVEATWTLAPQSKMRVADRGLREGLLLSMIRKQGNAKPSRSRNRSRKRKPKPSSTEAVTTNDG